MILMIGYAYTPPLSASHLYLAHNRHTPLYKPEAIIQQLSQHLHMLRPRYTNLTSKCASPQPQLLILKTATETQHVSCASQHQLYSLAEALDDDNLVAHSRMASPCRPDL